MKNQSRIHKWMKRVFTQQEIDNAPERSLRLAEEAIEYAQACGIDTTTLHRLVDYVMQRPPGEPEKELAGVLVTAYAAGVSIGANVDTAFEIELHRISTQKVMERIIRRQSEKREALSQTRSPST